MRNHIIFLSFILLVFFFVSSFIPARATTYTSMSDEALLDQSGIVITGTVTAIEQSSMSHRPETLYTVQVVETLKGRTRQDEITVAVPGGPGKDGMYLKIDGAPRFSVNHDVLLFLSQGEDGCYKISQFMLGSFIIKERNGMRFAERDLSEAQELPLGKEKSKAAAGRRERNSELFIKWIRDRAAGKSSSAAYWSSTPETIAPHVSYYQTQGGRWSVFDMDDSVDWSAYQAGQTNMAGGGFVEFQAALTAWTNDLNSNIDYQYTGTTSNTSGFIGSDDENTILFDDPNDEIDGSYDCSSGGVLALGGWWSWGDHTYNGSTFYTIVEGDVVTQDGAGCFFGENDGKNGEEVFAHELGHALGLGHSLDSEALMYPYAHGDGRGAALNQDDRNAINFLYTYTPVPPDVPDDPWTSIDEGAGEIAVNWNTVATTTFYQLFRSTESGNTGVEIYSGVDLQYTDGSIVTGTTYYYRVRACNDDGCSDFSNYAQGLLPGVAGEAGALSPILQLLLLK